jgi:hypothetical protein
VAEIISATVSFRAAAAAISFFRLLSKKLSDAGFSTA